MKKKVTLAYHGPAIYQIVCFGWQSKW